MSSGPIAASVVALTDVIRGHDPEALQLTSVGAQLGTRLTSSPSKSRSKTASRSNWSA